MEIRALEFFEKGIINDFEVGSFHGLSQIHFYLFQDVYGFAGKVRDVNIARGNFRFTPLIYLNEAKTNIDSMPQKNIVEMNVAHPFREGNGKSMRIWLDLILKKK